MAITRLGGSLATFDSMIQHFGVVTVMNAKVFDYDSSKVEGKTPYQVLAALSSGEKCEIKTLKVANVTVEGPSKTVTGGQYSNPLIKFGKSARLEMQDALGDIKAIDALCGGVAEWGATGTASETYAEHDSSAHPYIGLHVGEDFNGPVTIIGDSFFIDQVTGEQVKVKIIFYQFLPDSIFNLTQDAEGDATVFDMNGDLLTTVVSLGTKTGDHADHGVFYSIVEDK